MRSRSRGGAQGITGGQHDSIFLSIVNTLIHPPDFFSVTIVNGTEVSFIVNEETAQLFSTEALLGSMTDFVIPISFDFSNLPEDSTGIVAGVASQLYSYDPDKPFPRLLECVETIHQLNHFLHRAEIALHQWVPALGHLQANAS